MKGIYLTKEGKQAIEAKIAELKLSLKQYKKWMVLSKGNILEKIKIYKEILSSAIILPVEEDWTQAMLKEIDTKNMSELYPDGLIIKSE
jgi:hypothetical protein